MIAKGVKEYAEEMDIEIDEIQVCSKCRYHDNNPSNKCIYCRKDYHPDKRWVIQARNEGGYNRTLVDLIDLLIWLKKNKPELLEIVK